MIITIPMWLVYTFLGLQSYGAVVGCGIAYNNQTLSYLSSHTPAFLAYLARPGGYAGALTCLVMSEATK